MHIISQGRHSNGPYADSFPLSDHFQGGGGGGGGWVLGGGGLPDPVICGLKKPPHCADHFEVRMLMQKIETGGGRGGGMVGGTFV